MRSMLNLRRENIIFPLNQKINSQEDPAHCILQTDSNQI